MRIVFSFLSFLCFATTALAASCEPPKSLPNNFLYGDDIKLIIISLRCQSFAAYENRRIVVDKNRLLRGRVSTGKKNVVRKVGKKKKIEVYQTAITTTPHWITHWENLRISREYPKPDGGAEMPYWMAYNESQGIGLHVGFVPKKIKPGFGHSHGCVRLRWESARKLFSWTRPNKKLRTPAGVMVLYDFPRTSQAIASSD